LITFSTDENADVIQPSVQLSDINQLTDANDYDPVDYSAVCNGLEDHIVDNTGMCDDSTENVITTDS
jgi:hypothetical protein